MNSEELTKIINDGLTSEDSAEEVAAVNIEDTAADVIEAATSRKELSFDNIAHLIKVLGDDVINDMLVSAGLESEIEAEAAEEASGSPGRKKRSKQKIYRRLLLVFIFFCVLLIPLALNLIYMNAIINTHDPIQYSTHTDAVSCADGALIVNNVRVTVPTDGTEEYSISYAWSEEDENYPSVPHTITAVYPAKGGTNKYSLSLYRNETIPKKQVPKGKTAENWFDDWTITPDENVRQEPLKTKTTNGFYICPSAETLSSEDPAEYNDYSYYFAVQEKDGISIYVLEGVCLDEQYAAELPDIMDGCINHIKIKKAKTTKKPDTEQS